MLWLHRLISLFRNLFRKGRKDRQLDEELDSYVQFLAEKKTQAGMNPREAHRQALAEMGGRETIKEKVREKRIGHGFDTLLQDLRYGLRMLRRNPVFTAAAVLTLAIGIGANTTIFSVVHAVLLQPLPYPEAEKLVTVWETKKGNRFKGWVSFPNFLDWEEKNQSFERMAAYSVDEATLTEGDEPLRITVAKVTSGFFSVLGTQPTQGRFFLAGEDQPGNNLVAVLSYRLWVRAFGKDPAIVNEEVSLEGLRYSVAGIAPVGFEFPDGIDLWIPLDLDPATEGRRSQRLRVVARLRETVSLQQAQADMENVAGQLARMYPSQNTDWTANVLPLHEYTVGDTRPALLLLFAAVGAVFLIACANVANLMLARATTRERELAVRAALGASPARLIRQLLAESVLLALLGGGTGVLLSIVPIQFLKVLGPQDLVRLDTVALNGPVEMFALLLSLVAAIMFGCAPGLAAARVNLLDALRRGARNPASSGGSSARDALITCEIALAFLLLVASGLLLKSFYSLFQVDPGFDPDHVLTLRVALPSAFYPDATKQRQLHNRLIAGIQSLPGVEQVGAIQHLPLQEGRTSLAFAKQGKPLFRADGSFNSSNLRVAAPGYFAAMKIRVDRGRPFDSRDTEKSASVVVINQAMADTYWGEEDPLGQQIKLSASGLRTSRTIVGIVHNVRHTHLDASSQPEMFIPINQAPSWALKTMTYAIRTSLPPASLTEPIRAQVRNLDPGLPVYRVETMRRIVLASVARRRFLMLLLVCFSSIALALASVGIYGVVTYSVNHRTHEIGVRMALGAQPWSVLRLVLGRGLLLTGIGTALGLGGAYGLTRFLKSLLYEVGTTDPATYLAVSVLLAATTLLACYIPARRASRVDPIVALHYE